MTKAILCNKISVQFRVCKSNYTESRIIFVQVSGSSLLRNWGQCCICRDWMACLPLHLFCSMPQTAAITQICSVLRCLLLAAKSWVQSQVISHASAWSPLWAVRLMFSVLGATVQVSSSLSLARGAPREQGPMPGISLGHEHSPTLHLVLSVQS